MVLRYGEKTDKLEDNFMPMMKAAVMRKPGVVEVSLIDKPEPQSGEILLKVEACAICGLSLIHI